MTIPWDQEVEFSAPAAGSALATTRATMTLREAVDRFAKLPPSQQGCCGVGLAEPIAVMWGGQPVRLAFLNRQMLLRLADGDDLSEPPPQLVNRREDIFPTLTG